MKISLCCSLEQEYENVINAYQLSPETIIPAFGWHPWYAHLLEGDDDDVWIEILRDVLEGIPCSIIGEIGVDKACYTEEGEQTFESHQVGVFERQFVLAMEMKKAVSVHCVRAQGYLLDYFRGLAKKKVPYFPKVLLHSFTGHKEMVKSFLKVPRVGKRFYFSFSAAINLTNGSKKLNEAILEIPDDRILIESDQSTIHGERKAMSKIIEYLSELKGWDHEETIRITTENALRFFEQEE
eukprot:TRINITY_DN7899_c0_g1_i1.p1 TRINITY_DN7899_c0_g1~~TRINITY_DN7899_c0_g1_i1.p1  ORF type:complete len:278 (+),score=57.13 TRINITY_DN7899_c0_g1_i1:120-836(+)